MIDIGIFYWLLAAFLLYAAWCNVRDRRWIHAGFWLVLAILFASGDAILAARKTGNPLPAQWAGIGVIANRAAAAGADERSGCGEDTWKDR